MNNWKMKYLKYHLQYGQDLRLYRNKFKKKRSVPWKLQMLAEKLNEDISHVCTTEDSVLWRSYFWKLPCRFQLSPKQNASRLLKNVF